MPKTLPNFQHIGPRTSLYTPPEPTVGELVIICTWLGAAPKHINKYVAMHQRTAPGARILLIESAVPIMVSSYARQQRHIHAAAHAILDVLDECRIGGAQTEKQKPSPKVLLHAFSNGGTNTATQLLIALRQKRVGPLPLLGVVFDSCPAKGTYWKSYSAMVLSLPQDFVTQLVGAIAVHILLCLLYTWIACGNENPASLQRRIMLDEAMVVPVPSLCQDRKINHMAEVVKIATCKADKSRCQARYMYSTSDRMCLWNDVHDHAEEARRLGWGVEEVGFEGTAHCAHYSADATRYENTVRRLWSGEVASTAISIELAREGEKVGGGVSEVPILTAQTGFSK